jgi:DNA topoisomerase IA
MQYTASRKKITAHHAIIPTSSVVASAPLTDAERAVYELIA